MKNIVFIFLLSLCPEKSITIMEHAFVSHFSGLDCNELVFRRPEPGLQQPKQQK
ncbi:hypothetical protein WN51_14589 [Melipona quadrifasciata]|uniref:Uncharacterized protein n=1 Tax=Melipona quadrifasciata TaxID=166423 RepID=A0A0N0U505_9HYME|nr:hypothetical protein WN51_14589 [Melipona quadrifasciata]